MLRASTTTATVTLHTGMDPEEHGIIGYIQYLKDVGSVCNMISLTLMNGALSSPVAGDIIILLSFLSLEMS